MVLQINILKVFCFTVLLATVFSRRYDIEDESRKLYGKDFKSVLLDFRQTAAYKKILTSVTLKDLYNERFTQAYIQAITAQQQRLKMAVQNMVMEHFGVESLEPKQDEAQNPNISASLLRSHGYSDRLYKDGFGNVKLFKDKSGRRNEESTTFATEEERVDNKTKTLDNFRKKQLDRLSPVLNNKALDLAFEYTGSVIHDTLKFLSFDDEFKSTRMPEGNQTTHALVHTVTPSSTLSKE